MPVSEGKLNRIKQREKKMMWFQMKRRVSQRLNECLVRIIPLPIKAKSSEIGDQKI